MFNVFVNKKQGDKVSILSRLRHSLVREIRLFNARRKVRLQARRDLARIKNVCVLVIILLIIIEPTAVFCQEDKDNGWERFTSMGAGIGTGFGSPGFIFNAHFTMAPFKYFFVEPGMDIGLWQTYTTKTALRYTVHSIKVSGKNSYHSFIPYLNIETYYNACDLFGLHAGWGVSYLFANYTKSGQTIMKSRAAMDYIFGAVFCNLIDVSVTFRTDYSTAFNTKLQFSFIYRFSEENYQFFKNS